MSRSDAPPFGMPVYPRRAKFSSSTCISNSIGEKIILCIKRGIDDFGQLVAPPQHPLNWGVSSLNNSPPAARPPHFGVENITALPPPAPSTGDSPRPHPHDAYPHPHDAYAQPLPSPTQPRGTCLPFCISPRRRIEHTPGATPGHMHKKIRTHARLHPRPLARSEK